MFDPYREHSCFLRECQTPPHIPSQQQHYNSIFQSFVERTELLWWTNRLSQLMIKTCKIVNLTGFCVSQNLKSDGIKQINIKLDVYMSAFQSCVLISLADGCMRQTDLQWTYFFRLRWDRDKKWFRLGTVPLYLVIASTCCMPQSHAFCYDFCRSKFTNQVQLPSTHQVFSQKHDFSRTILLL